MVEMATIRNEGFTGVPLLLGADTLTEAVATAIPSADPRREDLLDRPRFSHPPPVMPWPSGDASLPANLMFEIAITKYLGRTHRVSKVGVAAT
jgi:hypothetical protein